MLWGFFQKLVVADRLAILVNTVYDNPSAYKGLKSLKLTIFFSCQIIGILVLIPTLPRGAATVLRIQIN